MMKKMIVLFLMIMLYPSVNYLNGQNILIDSLRQAASEEKDEKSRILLLLEVANYLESYNPEESVQIAQEMYLASKKINYIKGMGIGLYTLGLSKTAQGDYETALKHHEESIKMAQPYNNKKAISDNLNNIGNIYNILGNYPKALSYYQQALKLREEIQHHQGVGACLNNIGNTYHKQGDYRKAIEYYEKSLEAKSKTQNFQSISTTHINLGSSHSELGEHEIAQAYYQKSLALKDKLNDKKGKALLLVNIGLDLCKQNKQQEAISYFEQSLQLNQEINNKRGMSNAMYGFAYAYIGLKEYEKAIIQAKKGLYVAQKIKAMEEVKLLSQVLYDAYKGKGDFEKALEYHELLKQTEDSLFNLTKSKAIANLEARAEIDQKEKEITLLQKNSELLEKDRKLQKLELEKQKHAQLVLEKQTEADRLFALALHEKDKRKQDSLKLLAQKTQLEADKLKIKEEKIAAENRAKTLQIEKIEAKSLLLWVTSYTASIGFLVVSLFLMYAYKGWKKEQASKKLICAQRDEIASLNNNLERLVEKRTQSLEERNKQLEYYAFFNSHKLRHPVANLMGLYEIYLAENDPEQKAILLKYFDKSVQELDKVVHQIQLIVSSPIDYDLKES